MVHSICAPYSNGIQVQYVRAALDLQPDLVQARSRSILHRVTDSGITGPISGIEIDREWEIVDEPENGDDIHYLHFNRMLGS